ncbi:uncharacterized protein [Hyperolius riggenbachi]|uniref:uncharacterized protein n=1 Tax=Hyperolius riggenbachi TaxID=752182 RepID=UPI0035A3181F
MGSGLCLSVMCLLTVTGIAGALNFSIKEPEVTVYERTSIILPVAYYTEVEPDWFQIRWDIYENSTLVQLVICTIQADNSSQPPDEKSIKQFPPQGYEKRMTIFPWNGSLMIHHLMMKDTGTYRAYFLDSKTFIETYINITVIPVPTQEPEEVFTTEPETLLRDGRQCICATNSSVDVPTSAWIILSSRLTSVFIALLVILSLHIHNKKIHRQRWLSQFSRYR